MVAGTWISQARGAMAALVVATLLVVWVRRGRQAAALARRSDGAGGARGRGRSSRLLLLGDVRGPRASLGGGDARGSWIIPCSVGARTCSAPPSRIIAMPWQASGMCVVTSPTTSCSTTSTAEASWLPSPSWRSLSSAHDTHVEDRHSPARLAAAALGVGYLTQGMVSIDTVALLAWGWVAYAGVTAPETGSTRACRHTPTAHRDVRAVVAVGLVLVVIAGWCSVRPFRADLRARDSFRAALNGEATQAIDAAAEAATLDPLQPRHRLVHARRLTDAAMQPGLPTARADELLANGRGRARARPGPVPARSRSARPAGDRARRATLLRRGPVGCGGADKRRKSNVDIEFWVDPI